MDLPITELSQDAPDQKRRLFSHQWRRRTLWALIFSRMMTALAIALFVAGVRLYFSNFSFGAGGDTQGAVLVFAAPCLGLVAVIGNLYGIVAAWMTWRVTGSVCWLATAIVLPLLELLALTLVWRTM